jgi:hypothetical protein
MPNRRKIRNYYSLRRSHITKFYYFTLFSFIITIDQHWLYEMDINRSTKFYMNFHTFIELAVKVLFFLVVYIFQCTQFCNLIITILLFKVHICWKFQMRRSFQNLHGNCTIQKRLIGFLLGHVMNIILIIWPMRRTSFGRDKVHYSNDLTLHPRVDLSFSDQHVVSV